MMAPWILLQLAFLGLSTTQLLGQEPGSPNSSAVSPSLFDLHSALESQETIQIPNNGSAPLLVHVWVFVSNVFNVDILRYTMSSVLLLRLGHIYVENGASVVALCLQSWLDTRLAWNASVYPRRAVRLPWNSVWTPRLTIREALWVEWKDEDPQARVDHHGHVDLTLALTTETSCDFELLHFPRDDSECSLSFYSFGNTVMEMEFQAHTVNEIVSVKREYVVHDLKTQVPPTQLEPCFQVTLGLKNTALKSVLALLVPGEALLLADMCGGLLPFRAPERIAYKMTLLLGYLVFHSSLVQALPSASTCNPLLIYFFTVLLLLLFLSTMETILLAGLLARDQLGAKSGPSPVPGGERRGRENPTPDPEAAPRGGKGSRSWAEAADRTFSIVYVASVLSCQLIFAGVWMWATCKSDPPPGEGAPHGRKPWL